MINCQNIEQSNLDSKYKDLMTQSSIWLNRYLFACEYKDGNIISLSDSTMLLDSAMLYTNKAISLKSFAVTPYIRRVGILYLKQNYDSVLYYCTNHDSLKSNFSRITYKDYPQVLSNRTKARIREMQGDTTSRNKFIKDNVDILRKYVYSKNTDELLFKSKDGYDIFYHGEVVAIIDYFYYLSIINYDLSINKIDEFERKYPNQTVLIYKIKETLKQPLFWTPML